MTKYILIILVIFGISGAGVLYFMNSSDNTIKSTKNLENQQSILQDGKKDRFLFWM